MQHKTRSKLIIVIGIVLLGLGVFLFTIIPLVGGLVIFLGISAFILTFVLNYWKRYRVSDVRNYEPPEHVSPFLDDDLAGLLQ